MADPSDNLRECKDCQRMVNRLTGCNYPDCGGKTKAQPPAEITGVKPSYEDLEVSLRVANLASEKHWAKIKTIKAIMEAGIAEIGFWCQKHEQATGVGFQETHHIDRHRFLTDEALSGRFKVDGKAKISKIDLKDEQRRQISGEADEVPF